MAEVLQGSRPSSMGKFHGVGLWGVFPGPLPLWPLNPFPFPLCFPPTHSGRTYLLSAYCLLGSLFRNLIPKGNLQLQESWEYDLRQLVYWEFLNYSLYILILSYMVNYSLYLLPKISVKLKLVGPGTHISAIVPTQFLSHYIHTLSHFTYLLSSSLTVILSWKLLHFIITHPMQTISALLTFWATQFLDGGGCSVHCRIPCSIPDLSPLDANSILLPIQRWELHYDSAIKHILSHF